MERFNVVENPAGDLPAPHGGDRLLVEIPDGQSAIFIKTKNGNVVSLVFRPYEENGHPRCVDLQVHTYGEKVRNGNDVVPAFPVAVRSCKTGGVLYACDFKNDLPKAISPADEHRSPPTVVIFPLPEIPLHSQKSKVLRNEYESLLELANDLGYTVEQCEIALGVDHEDVGDGGIPIVIQQAALKEKAESIDWLLRLAKDKLP